MSPTAAQVASVQASWNGAKPALMKDPVAFYYFWFSRTPAAQNHFKYFKGKTAGQVDAAGKAFAEKVLDHVGQLIDSLNNIDAAAGTLKARVNNHKSMNITAADFESLFTALIAKLNPSGDTKAAWDATAATLMGVVNGCF